MPIPSQLALPLIAPVLEAGLSTARSAVDGFAQLLSSEAVAEEPKVPGVADTLEQIESAIIDHLNRSGIAVDEPLTLQLGEGGEIEVNLAHRQKQQLQESIASDEGLMKQLAAYLRERDPLSRHPILHWPPTQALH